MRLKCSYASAKEKLTAHLTEGYSILLRTDHDRNKKKADGSWNESIDKAEHGKLFDEWYLRMLSTVDSIFPTQRESLEIMYPPPPAMRGVQEDDFQWKTMRLNVRDKLEVLKMITDERLSTYTDLPQKLRLYVEDIDSFQKVRDCNHAMVANYLDRKGYFNKSEEEIQLAFEQILDVSFHKKDWGGEINDLYTANTLINGSRVATAFLLKGNGLRGPTMQLADCGKNGDQILRLIQSPAILFVVQYVGDVSEAVIKDLEGKIAELRASGKEAYYCIIDGQDTARVLLAYGKMS